MIELGRRRSAWRGLTPHACLWFAAVAVTIAAGSSVAALDIDERPPNVDAIVTTPRANERCEPGNADNGDFYDGDCRTDNGSLSWYADSRGDYELEEEDQGVVRWVMNQVYEPTDLTVTYDRDPSFSEAAETDVIFQERSTNFGDPNIIAITYCNDPENGTVHLCDQTYVNIRGNGDISRISVSHEVGHAVGLLHPSRSQPNSGRCDQSWQVMREAYTCIDSSALGPLLTNNINFTF